MSDIPFEIFSSLIIRGEKFTPTDISNRLNLVAKKSYLIGDEKRPNCGVFHEINGWHYEITSEDSAGDLNTVLELLISELQPLEKDIKSISESMDVIIFSAIYKESYWPSMHLSPMIVSFLFNAGATIDFDLYGS
jgi:hypothetical protein